MIGAIWAFIQTNWLTIWTIYSSIVTIASAIVLLTPTRKDDDILKAITDFVAKYLALNKQSPKP